MIPSFPRRQAFASILPRPLAMGEVAKLLAVEFMIVADHDVDRFFSSSVSRLTSDPWTLDMENWPRWHSNNSGQTGPFTPSLYTGVRERLVLPNRMPSL
jgi:hypothetical protein